MYQVKVQLTDVFFKFQIRNSKAGHLCMDQGMKENHTATLHPCHGWGPQVQHSASLSFHYFRLENTNNSLVGFASDMIYSSVSLMGSAETLSGSRSAVRIKILSSCTFWLKA